MEEVIPGMHPEFPIILSEFLQQRFEDHKQNQVSQVSQWLCTVQSNFEEIKKEDLEKQ
jgi:hypothetical protein